MRASLTPLLLFTFGTAALLALTLGAPPAALATFGDSERTFKVNCNSKRQTISRALERAHDGDTILVTGACTETLSIGKGVTLDGGGNASIAPASPSDATITVTGRNVTVRGFSLEAPALFQFFVYNMATLSIESNSIRNATNFGVSAAGNSNVVLLDNTITNNGLGGIIGLSGVEYGIGTRIAFDPPRPNIIADNGRIGLVLISNAAARVLGGNIITGHSLGIIVQDGAQARIAGNTIDGNDIGIFLDAGGTVQLPLVANAVPAFTELNSGVNNQFGIACKGGTLLGVPDGLAPAVRLPPTPGVLAGPSDGLTTHCLDQTVSLTAPAP